MTIKPKSFSIEEDHWEEFKDIVESRAGKNKCSNVLTSFIGLVTQGYIRVQTDSNLTFLDRYKFDGEDLYDLQGESVPTEPELQLAVSSSAPESIPNVEFSSLSNLDVKSHPDWIQFSGESHQKIQQLLYVLQDQQQQIDYLKTQLETTHATESNTTDLAICISSETVLDNYESALSLEVPEVDQLPEVDKDKIETEEVHYPTVHTSGEIINRLNTSFEIEVSHPEETTLVLQSVSEIRSWTPWQGVVTEVVVTKGVPLIPSTEAILLLKSTLRVMNSAPQFDGEVEQCKRYLQACLQESFNNPSYELTDDLNLMLEKALAISGMNGMH